jgi:hypothetical protein
MKTELSYCLCLISISPLNYSIYLTEPSHHLIASLSISYETIHLLFIRPLASEYESAAYSRVLYIESHSASLVLVTNQSLNSPFNPF